MSHVQDRFPLHLIRLVVHFLPRLKVTGALAIYLYLLLSLIRLVFMHACTAHQSMVVVIFVQALVIWQGTL